MIKKTGHIVISTWLAILLLFGSTPKEYIHLFSGHTDTVHSHLEKDGLVIEPEHHHCSFLSYSLPFFVNDAPVYKLHAPRMVYPVYTDITCVTYNPSSPLTAYLRGPPTIIS
ncbi:MAG TPA: hypothetical protein VK167_02140 [Flavipsychrobacter sp.]|nr:hypothetical protein [Flavipsychrobacter sp.]